MTPEAHESPDDSDSDIKASYLLVVYLGTNSRLCLKDLAFFKSSVKLYVTNQRGFAWKKWVYF